MESIVRIKDFTLKYQHQLVLQDLNWTIYTGENWLISGKSGSGKTSLAKAIANIIPNYGTIELNFNPDIPYPKQAYYVANWYQFKDLEGQSNFYYQQRYIAQVATTNTVSSDLKHFGQKYQLSSEELSPILKALNFDNMYSATLIQLSSGEHKKLQLVKALWLKSQLLILDLPYNGLDTASRNNLNDLLNKLVDCGTQLIIISNDPEIPSCINRFATIKDGKLVASAERQYVVEDVEAVQPLPRFLKEKEWLPAQPHVIKMIDVNVSYGDKKVLNNINWEVKAGEKWALQGPNGSGKSTLLSLVCADHPQAFANNFYLFGNKRGSGESIWEIKERIGLISPELHWYFDPSATVWESIVSGFYDSAGLFCEPGYTKKTLAEELIDYLGLKKYRNTLMRQLPLGKQRLALLGRTIIKNPELLILDEPCQGLDEHQTRHFNLLIDELCKNGTTLIYVGHFESQLPSSIEKRIVLENGKVKLIENILELVGNA